MAFNLTRDEFIDDLELDEELVSLDHGVTYYWTGDLQEPGE